MKKFLYALAAVALMSTTSCSNEDFPESSTANGDEVTVTFSAGLDAASASRGFTPSDGTTAKNLTVVAYLKGEKTVAATTTATMDEELHADVSLRLVKGREYDVVFWAQAEGAPYTFNEDAQTISVSYDKAVTNDETRDAFYKKYDLKVSESDTDPISVQLSRPFAKVSIATTYEDYVAAKACKSRYYFTGFEADVYDTFDLMTGEPSGTATTRTFDGGTFIDDEGYVQLYALNGAYYIPICVNYLLANSSKSELTNCSFTYGDISELKYSPVINPKALSNVPVQANYITVILGSFFTRDVNFDVEINPALDGVKNVSAFDNDLEKVAFVGGDVTLDEDTTLPNSLYVGSTTPVNIDLGGHTLTLNEGVETLVDTGSQLTIKNGTLNCNSPSVDFWVGANGSLTLDDVTMNGTTFAVYPQGNSATVIINKCHINVGASAIATNASTVDNYNVIMEVTDSEIKSETPLWINIPGTMTVKGCTLYGSREGLMVRGGTVTVSDTSIELTNDEISADNAAELYAEYRYDKWGTGNGVPYAGIVVGNRGAAAYDYKSTLTLNNVKVKAPKVGDFEFPAIYAYSYSKSSNVTITYSSDCVFDGPVQYASPYTSVNGSVVEQNVADTQSADTGE